MKLHIYRNEGDGEEHIALSGMELSGPLVLKGDPIGSMEAAPRRYVTDKLTRFKALDVTRGKFAVSRLPGFRGDVVNSPGTGVLELNETGVVEGTHCKLLVSADGRVRGGSALNYADIPSIPWSKITTGKPDNLVGYGIVDAVKNSGDSLEGDLRLYSLPVNDNHAATVSFANILIQAAPSMIVGQVVEFMGDGEPEGMLECDGSFVRQDMYAELYAVVGDRFLGDETAIVGQFRLPDLSDSAKLGGRFFIKH